MGKRIFVWGWHKGSPAKAIEAFCTHHDFQIVQWLRNDENRTIDRLIHRPFELEDGKIDLSYGLISKIEGKRAKFMEMYSRITIGQVMSYPELNSIFWIYVKQFDALFDALQPDILLMGSAPHFGADYVMYELARLRGIKTKVVLQTLFANRFLCVDSIPEFGDFNVEPDGNEKKFFLDDYRGNPQFYMKNVKYFRKSSVLSFIRNVLVGPHQFKPMPLEAAIVRLKDGLHYKKVIRKICVAKPNFEQKYVYFPLQLQPEMTTSILGGDIYSDQILALESLHSFLPKDWKIYAKEHPMQSYRQRSRWFYRRLRALDKVEYIDVRVSSAQLIQESQFVAVITGTAGWEALLAGKSVLSFGLAWFNVLPGVFRLEDQPELKDLIDFKSDQDALEERFNALMFSMYEGLINDFFKPIIKNYSDETNVRDLVKSLEKILL